MSFLSVIDIHEVVLAEESDRSGIRAAKTPVQLSLDELKQARWLDTLGAKSCQGRWCCFEDSQRWWVPFPWKS